MNYYVEFYQESELVLTKHLFSEDDSSIFKFKRWLDEISGELINSRVEYYLILNDSCISSGEIFLNSF